MAQRVTALVDLMDSFSGSMLRSLPIPSPEPPSEKPRPPPVRLPPKLPPVPPAETLSCLKCKVSVPIDGGSRMRQNCPFCGSAYNAYSANDANSNSNYNSDSRLRRGRPLHVELPFLENQDRSNLGNSPFGERPLGLLANDLAGRREQSTSVSLSSSATTGVFDMLRGTYRVGSGSSLPPIRRQEMEARQGSRRESLLLRSAKSEERISSRMPDLQRPIYPKRTVCREDFMQEVRRARDSKNFNDLKHFYFDTFDSYASICATFKRDPEYDGARIDDPGLKTEFMYSVHDAMYEMPSVVHKNFLKAVINSLLQERPLLYAKDQVRSLFIILQSPVFLSQSSYTVLAHVLRTISSLSNADHQLLVHWFKTIDKARFRQIVGFTMQFITVRQFPPVDRSLPPLNKSRWWIPTATRVLAVFYASNTSTTPSLIHYTEFYNHALDHLDLMEEYRNWQSPQKSDSFSYCQYPFILSIVAKRHILTKDAEQQMILTARRSLVDKVSRHQAPQIDIFFLNIHVRRNNLLEDSMKEIAYKKRDLKKKLKVTFEGEPGLDMGGLTKEWFLLLIKQIFQPENRMFVYHEAKRLYWFSMGQDTSLREYNLIGVLMGLAVYNSTILDVRFPSICYRKLLSPPIVPMYDYIPVGLAKDPSSEDLSEIMPEVAHSLQELMKYEGNVEDDMCLSFQVSLEEYGQAKTYNLKENGENVPVTNANREEFVGLYLDWILNTAIYEKFRAFYLGFNSVCASNALIMLRPEEVEMLVCGSPTLDLTELRKVVEYDGGYNAEHPTIRWFWEIIGEMPLSQQKQFLLFTTGSDRIPVGGMGEMIFKISCWKGMTQMLPQAHTCFNQLVLPPYGEKSELKSKLVIAIANAEGFGLE